MASSRSLLCFVGTAAGFAPQPAWRPESAVTRGSARMDSSPFDLDSETSRRAVLAAAAGAVIGVGAQPAFAGWSGYSLGLETTSPKDAERDDDLLNTNKVQTSLKNIIKYQSSAVDLRTQFSKNKDMALIPPIRKAFDFSQLRDDLNVVGSVFDDTTQSTLDRIARSILYDVTELEN